MALHASAGRKGRREQFPGSDVHPFATFSRSGEFRALWASQILSVGGDRLALVALTFLIYDRTRSPLLAAVAFAAGNAALHRGRAVPVRPCGPVPAPHGHGRCDVARVALVAVMLIPAMPLDALIALLYVVTA